MIKKMIDEFEKKGCYGPFSICLMKACAYSSLLEINVCLQPHEAQEILFKFESVDLAIKAVAVGVKTKTNPLTLTTEEVADYKL